MEIKAIKRQLYLTTINKLQTLSQKVQYRLPIVIESIYSINEASISVMHQISSEKTDHTSHCETSGALIKFEMKNHKNETEGKRRGYGR